MVAALTSRLQALHAHLQAFVEQVDGLVKPAAGGKDTEEDGESPLASNGGPLPCPDNSQDGADLAEKVNTLLFTPFTHFLFRFSVIISAGISFILRFLFKVQSFIMFWLNNTPNAHPHRCFNFKSGVWIYTTQSNLMIRPQHEANYGLFITFGPRDGVENETLNEQNTLRCLLARTCSDLSC